MNFDGVCCILDLDGFTLSCGQSGTGQPEFLIRELGYIRVDETTDYPPQSYHFDLRKRLDELKKCMSPDANRALQFQSKKIICLSLLPDRGQNDAVESAQLDTVVREIYEQCKVLPYKTAIAYKGGNIEKDLLDRLGIPGLNLELFGCPSFKVLVSQFPSRYQHDCGRHHKRPGGRVSVHCPLAEVTAFKDWYKSSYNQFKGCCGRGSSSPSSSRARSWSRGSSSDSSDA